MGHDVRNPRDIYVQRINAAMDFIEANLRDELSLERVAGVANFSPFHFHRVFSAMTGETLSRFIMRIRVEKAASLLLREPPRPVSAIAADCGFSTPSAFARAFKAANDLTPSEWRVADRLTPSPTRPVNVDVRTIESISVSYVRNTGPFEGNAAMFGELFSQLGAWASAQGISRSADRFALYHDHPQLTDLDQLRVSACVASPASTIPEPPVGQTTIASGSYAVGRFELGAQDYAQAWRDMLAGWLPDSGFEPDDRLCLERFPLADTSSAGRMPVEIWIPVQRLRR